MKYFSFALLLLVLVSCTSKENKTDDGRAKTTYGKAVESARDVADKAGERAKKIDEDLEDDGEDDGSSDE